MAKTTVTKSTKEPVNTFEELVAAREQEMGFILPGFTTVVRFKGKEKVVSSPSALDRVMKVTNN